MEALGIDPAIIIAYFANFAILVVVLRLVAYKPVMAMLERRKTAIAEGLAAAERQQAEAEKERASFQEELEKARQSSQEEASRIAKATSDMREQILEDARKEAEAIKERARVDIANEREAMQAEMRRQLADLTVTLTRRLVAQTMDETSQRGLIDKFLEEEMGVN